MNNFEQAPPSETATRSVRGSTKALLLVAAIAASPLLLFFLGSGLGNVLDCGPGAGLYHCKGPMATSIVNGLLGCGFLAIFSLPAGFVVLVVMACRKPRPRQALAPADASAKYKRPPQIEL